MARIRSIKPSFFRHEKLQDLEIENPGKFVMLTFVGIWTLCDSKGRFEYKPRHIKLDVLPFLPYDISETLDILCQNEFILKYQINGLLYGFIPSFLSHQRITGKELIDGERFPEYQQGTIGETTGKQLVVQEKERSIRKGDIPEFQKNETTGVSLTESNVESITVRCDKFLKAFNSKKEKYSGAVGRFRRTESVIKSFKARIKDYDPRDILKAIDKAFSHQYHKETNFQYVTPEYILREKILERYINISDIQVSSNQPVYTEKSAPIDHANR